MNETGLLVVVPARGGSKRLPGKNLRALEGHSLLERAADALRASNVQATCVLSTDDDAIATAGKVLGWQVPFRRPTSLATDDAATVPVVIHAVDWFADTHGHDPALVMVLQVTSPFRGSACITEALARLDAKPDADAVVAVTRIDRTPRQLFSTGDDGYVAPLSSEDVPSPVLTPNGALYLVRTHALRQTGSLFPPRTLPLVMNCIAAIDIDDDDDWHLAEAVAARGLTGTVIG
ncbi:MAG: acylneuraminate cytidylyltransferase family protein [Alphaproteobacteria bacterium]|nr:acylneuraminate cytidylyltransferase family protein [Alphaproteobacteria bacterium]